MAKQLNVNLAMTADTSKAKAELQSLQKQLNDLMLSTQKNNSSLGLSKDIQKATQMAAQLKVQLEAATGSTGKLDLTKFNDQLRKSKTSIQDYQKALTSLGPAGTQAFSNLASSIMQAEVPLRRANKALDEFATSLANTARWQLSSSILHGFMGAIQGAYRYAQDLNESLNNIRIVTGNSTEQMSKFALEANKAAKALSTTTTSYTDAALIYYQQGLSEKEVKARTDATIKMANVSRQSAEEVSSQMTAIWNNFAKGGENLEYYADVITKLGAATAASSDEIAQGLQKFASVADTVGLSYEKATAALATVVAETRQSADVVGTAFKTMFARFQGLQLGETLEDGVGLNKYSKALATVGVQILDANGELKQMDTILDDVAVRWNSISEAQKVALAETVAGTRQYAQFMAIMNNYDKILENQKLGASSGGTLNKQAEIYAESWEAAEKRVKAAAQGIYDDLISDDFFITMLNGFEKALSAVDNFIKGIGGLGPMLSLVGNMVLEIFGNKINNAIRNTLNSIQSMSNSGRKAAEDLRSQAVSGLINTATSQLPTNEGQGTKSAYLSYAKVQDNYAKQATQMSEEQRKQAQLLIDINKQMGQEAINAGKVLDIEIKTTKELATQMKKKVLNSSSISNYNKVKTEIENIEKAYKQVDIAYDTYEKKMFRKDVNGSNVQDYKNSILEVVKAYQSANIGSDEFKKRLDILNKMLSGEIKTAPENIAKVWHSVADAIDGGVDPSISRLIQLLKDSGFTSEEATTMANKYAQSLQGQKDKTNDLNAAQERLKINEDATIQRIKSMRAEYDLTANTITRLSSIFMAVNTAVQAFKNLGNIWNDEDLSTGEKILQTFSSLSMIIPLVTTLLNAQNVTWIQNMYAAIAESTSLSSGAIAKKVYAFATQQATAANLSFWASLGPIAIIVGAVALAIWGAVEAYKGYKKAQEEAFKNSPEGKLQTAKENAEELSQQLSEATTQAEELKSAFDGYDEIYKKLHNCAKGTEEWTTALETATKTTNELLENHPELWTRSNAFDENGLLRPEIIKELSDHQTSKSNLLRYASYQNDAQIIELNSSIAQTSLHNQQSELSSGVHDNLLSGFRELTWEALQELDKALYDSDFFDIVGDSFANFYAGIDNQDEETKNKAFEYLSSYFKETNQGMYEKYFVQPLQEFASIQQEINEEGQKAQQALFNTNKKIASEVLGSDATELEIYNATRRSAEAGQEKLQSFNGIDYLTGGKNNEALKSLVDDYFKEYLDDENAKAPQIFDVKTDDQGTLISFTNGETIYLKEMQNVVVGGASRSGAKQGAANSTTTGFLTEAIAKQANANGGNYNINDIFASMTYGQLSGFKASTTDLNALSKNFGISKYEAGEGYLTSLNKFNEYRNKYSSLNGANATLQDYTNLENNANKAQQYLSKYGITTNAWQRKLEQQGSVEGLSQFYKSLQDINLSSYDASEQVTKLAQSCGLSEEATNAFVKGLETLPRTVDTSTDKLVEQAKAIGDIIGNGLKLGDTITKEQGDTLKAAGMDISKYFAIMADGTLKLVGDAEKFNAAARGITIQGYANKQSQFDQARADAGNDDIEYIRKFQDLLGGTDIFEKALGGDPEAIEAALKAIEDEYYRLGNSALYSVSTLKEYDEWSQKVKTTDEAKKAVLDLLMPEQIKEANTLKDLKELLDKYNYTSDDAVKKGQELADAAIKGANSFDDLKKVMADIQSLDFEIDLSAYGEQLVKIAENALSSAGSLEEFDEALMLAKQYGLEFTEQDIGQYLINLGNKFDNCASQVRKYAAALKDENDDLIASTKDELRAAIAVNDLGKKYGLNTKTLDAHARAIKANNQQEVKSMEQAVSLAVANERMNAGVKALHDNFETWSKTLRDTLPTSMDYAATFADMEQAVRDLVGALDDFELPYDFFEAPEHMELLKQAAEGSQHAINKLGAEIAGLQLGDLFDTYKNSIDLAGQSTEEFRNTLTSATDTILANLTNLENGSISFEEAMNKASEGGLKTWVSNFNELVKRAGLTVSEVNSILNQMGLKADIELTTVEQDIEVPQYEVTMSPIGASTAGYSEAFNAEGQSLGYGYTGPDASYFANGKGVGGLGTGYIVSVKPLEPKKMKGYTQVPTINSPSTIKYKGVGGGALGGGVSPSSTPNTTGGGSKGGGGGSSPTHSSKQHAQPSSNPYQGIEKQIDRLNSQYNKLERARKRAYGEGALSIIKQEIEKTKELANAQRDYIKAIAGEQGLNFAKIIEQGGDLGAAIKAAGGGGGQLGKVYKELLYGKNEAFEITMKDSDGNETTVKKSTSGIGMDIKISSTGVIENYDELEQHIYDKYNAEVDWWNSLKADEQQDPANIARMEIAEKTRDIELQQLEETQEQLDALWDQSDKLAEIRDGLYDLNYSLLSEKIHLKVDIAERQLKFLQYQIKILGDNIYKIPEAMNKLFGGGDSVYGKLQNLANTWKDAFYEAQSLYGLDPEEGGISAADYADMIKQAQDGLYNVIDQLLDMNEQMRNYYKKALQGVLEEMQAITSQMEHQVSIVGHLRNILSLLGRETDWTAMEGLIQGQMHMQHNNYQVSRAEAEMLKGEVQHAYANLASLQAQGVSEDALYEFKRAVLQPAIEAAIQAEEKMYSDLEAFIQSINDLFKVYLDKAIDKYQKSMVGLYGTIDYLNDSMSRAAAIADEYLTTTNKLYETNELLRKIGQDMDKSDSAYAKRKLKNFADEIQQLQNRRLLQKSDLELAKARYELLQAEIALTEAQNAKSTVRLQRDNEGNYGYVYTADRDAIDNAEADFAEKQNNLYNIALEQANNALTALVQLDQEYTANLKQLAEDRANGLIQTEEEYQFKVAELTKQYNDKREALIHTYNTALVVLNETGAEGSTEAWVTHYDTVLTSAQDNHAQVTDLIYDLNSTLQWLNQERAAITAEAQLDTQGMIATVGQLTAENDKLAAEMTGTVIPKAQALLSTVNDLTAAWAAQYDQIMALIQEYMNLIDVMQQALEALAAEENQNQQNQQDNPFDMNKDYSIIMYRTHNDAQAMLDRNTKIGYQGGFNEPNHVYDTNTTAAIVDAIYDLGMQNYFEDTLGTSFRNVKTGLHSSELSPELIQLRDWLIQHGITGFATGGYTGDFKDGKLAFLHQKELVLNETDTANLLASVKIIRSIADAIGLRAAAANTESSIAPGFIPGQGALEQTVTIHAEFPNATNHNEIEEAFANLVNRATQYAGRISANADRE